MKMKQGVTINENMFNFGNTYARERERANAENPDALFILNPNDHCIEHIKGVGAW